MISDFHNLVIVGTKKNQNSQYPNIIVASVEILTRGEIRLKEMEAGGIRVRVKAEALWSLLQIVTAAVSISAWPAGESR